MRSSIAVLSAAAVVLAGALALTPAASASPSPNVAGTGGYTAVTPVRTANGAYLGAGATKTVAIAGGTTGVPTSASAVAVDVSVLSPYGTGALTIWAGGVSRPSTANVQFNKGKRAGDLAVVTSNSTGQAQVYNSSAGSLTFYVDVVGYYSGGAATSSVKSYHPVKATRVVSTTIAANKTVNPVLGGRGPLPGSGVGAVAVTFGESGGTSAGYLTAKGYNLPINGERVLHWPGGAQRAGAFAIVPVDADGTMSITNSSAGAATITVDVVGYYLQGAPYDEGMLNTVPASRLLQTTSVAAGGTRTVAVAGHGGVPLTGVRAVVVTVTATSTGDGSLVAWQGGTRPNAASVQFAAGVTTSGVAIVPVSSSGTITLYNHATKATTVSMDVTDWVLDSDLTVPSPTTSRYLDDLTISDAHNTTVMAKHGTADASEDPSLVLLDVGAQSYRGPLLSKTNPGVALALTSPTVRITYSQLVTAVDAYVAALADHLPAGHTATVAVGTNNSGNFTDNSDPTNPIYDAMHRGADWTNKVIEQVDAPAAVTVVGADDIENGNPNTDGFDNSVTRALQWETSYLNARPSRTGRQLIYNGSANGCPTSFGSGTATTKCADGWTLQQFVELTDHKAGITVLPQIYFSSLAVQWANIARVAKAAGDPLDVAGSLTEMTVDFSLPPRQGWAALHNALGTLVTSPSIPAAVDVEPASAAGRSLEARRATA